MSKLRNQKLEDKKLNLAFKNSFLLQLESEDQTSNKTFSEPPFKYRDGPHPLISGYNHGPSRSLSTLITFTFSRQPFLLDHLYLRRRDFSLCVLRILLAVGDKIRVLIDTMINIFLL